MLAEKSTTKESVAVKANPQGALHASVQEMPVMPGQSSAADVQYVSPRGEMLVAAAGVAIDNSADVVYSGKCFVERIWFAAGATGGVVTIGDQISGTTTGYKVTLANNENVCVEVNQRFENGVQMVMSAGGATVWPIGYAL